MNPAIILLPSLILAIPHTVQAYESPFHNSDEAKEFRFFQLHDEQYDTVIRGQSPQTFGTNPPTMNSPQVQGVQPQVAPFDPNAASTPYYGDIYGQPPVSQGYDPFLASPYAGAMGDPYGGQYGYGVVGPQPVRLGWSSHFDFAYIAKADIEPGPGGVGNVTVFEYDLRFDYVAQGVNGWTWKQSPEFDYTQLNFQNIEASRLPVATQNGLANISDNYYRLAYRFETTSPQNGLWTWRLGFTPAIATDFERNLNSQGWNFDGDITGFYRVNPQWLLVAGVLYWDRAEDHILPNAGAVWTPNQFWEIRATFPKSRAEVFVGTPFGVATWLYAGAEYDIESWQAGEVDDTKPQLQIEEWRAFGGFRWEACTWDAYLDFGYAFDRKYSVHTLSTVTPLHPEDGFMIRYGVNF